MHIIVEPYKLMYFNQPFSLLFSVYIIESVESNEDVDINYAQLPVAIIV